MTLPIRGTLSSKGQVRAYADSRRNRVLPHRIAADFLIAAHAEHHGASVLTFDATVYQAVFPNVKRIALT